ncbi:MAG TPA: DnaJ domain-containing protein [Stellaceae bacterium]
MLFLLGGFVILCGLLLLGYLFVNANPAKLARAVKWGGLGIGALLLVGVVVLTEGRILVYLAPLVPVLPMFRRVRSMFSGMSGPAAGQTSDVETPFLRMSLDHDTGAMSGTVLRGRFAGMRLDELARADLLDLLRECRAEDEESARLVEAFLDRQHPDWHDDLGHGQSRAHAPSASGDMTVEEAYAILGLNPGATVEEIRAAHRRLMQQLHPDHGGTDYLATKINRARDVLLKA